MDFLLTGSQATSKAARRTVSLWLEGLLTHGLIAVHLTINQRLFPLSSSFHKKRGSTSFRLAAPFYLYTLENGYSTVIVTLRLASCPLTPGN